MGLGYILTHPISQCFDYHKLFRVQISLYLYQTVSLQEESPVEVTFYTKIIKICICSTETPRASAQPLPLTLLAFRMLNPKTLLKYIILLGVWSVILIMIVRTVSKTTSTTFIPKDRVLSNDVLIDKRKGKQSTVWVNVSQICKYMQYLCNCSDQHPDQWWVESVFGD